MKLEGTDVNHNTENADFMPRTVRVIDHKPFRFVGATGRIPTSENKERSSSQI